MANLNKNDLLFLGSSEFSNFPEKLEKEYGFKILNYDLPPYISFTSRKIILKTNKGDFFLKEKPEYCSSKLKRETAADFQSFLSSKLEIVPSILKTINNDLYVEWNGRYFFLTEYKKGRVFNGSEEDLIQILNALKEFQLTARDFESNIKNSQSYDLLIPFQIIKNLGRTDTEKRFLAIAENILNKLKQEYLDIGNDKYTMSHGDFSLFNIIFSESSVIAINDFDNSQKLPRIQDMAEFLVSATITNYLAPLTNLKNPVFLKPESGKFNLIVNYYLKNFDLTNKEKELLPILAELVWLDILLLSVLKGDHSFSEIYEALKIIEKGDLRGKIKELIVGQKTKIFIWDFYGTLEIGTIKVLNEIANILLKQNGSDKIYSLDEFTALPSFSWRIFFKEHFPYFDDNKIESIANEAYNEEIFKDIIQKYSRPNNNALYVLSKIKESGGINVVISNSRQDKLGYYISQIGASSLIDLYFGLDDGNFRSSQDVMKKKTLLIDDIVQKYKNHDTYVVGDTEVDLTAARLNSIKTFYFLNDSMKSGFGGEIYNDKIKFITDLKEIL